MGPLVLVAALLALAGCASAPRPPGPGEGARKGAYYADDGPPERVPPEVAAVPDAVPRAEPYHRFANRPYTVFGRTYTPLASDAALRERGVASWYGKKFHGQKTSSGETYDMFAMSAAHKTLPIPSFARVTSVRDGRSVVVRVNDRGPFHEDRIIDLSYAAAARLGISGPGSGLVEVERVFPEMAPAASPSRDPPAPAAATAPATRTFALAPTPAVVASPPDAAPAARIAATSPAATVPKYAPPATGRSEEPNGPAPDGEGLWLQLAAFSSGDKAEAFQEKVAKGLPWLLEPVTILVRDGLYRVRLGPYRNRGEALAIAEKVRESLGLRAVLAADPRR